LEKKERQAWFDLEQEFWIAVFWLDGWSTGVKFWERHRQTAQSELKTPRGVTVDQFQKSSLLEVS